MKKLLTVVLSAVFAFVLVVGVVPQTAITAYADDFIIYSQPRSTTCIEGAEVYYTIAVSGLTDEATYQWQVDRNMGPDADCIEDGPYVDCFEDEGYDTRNNFKVLATMEKNGNWYRCKVTDSTGTVKYSYGAYLVVEADPYVKLDTPVVTASNDPATGKVKLTWNAIEGADKYTVYRAETIDGEYNIVVGYTTDTYMIHEFSSPGVTYYYKVQAVNESDSRCSSDLSEVAIGVGAEPVVKLETPTLTASNVASTGKIKVSWNAVSGATKYTLYHSTTGKTGSWTAVNTTKTSITHSSAKAGTKYYYKVRAIAADSRENSALSAAVTRVCDLAQPVVTTANVTSTGKIKISWNAVDGASKYILYHSTTGKTGSWTAVNVAATKTSITHSSAKAGTKYYYKVRAISTNSSANSAYSAAKTRTCDLARPTVSVKLNSKGKPVISWNAVDGASKYILYRSTTGKTGSWTAVNVAATKNSITHSSAVAGTKYYYKVRAIHTNTDANSAYSTAVSITAKASVIVTSKPSTYKYVVNTNTLKVHYPTCSSVKKISAENIGYSNGTIAQIKAEGYTSCGNCKP